MLYTTGEYVSLAAARAKKLALNCAELLLQAERGVAEADREQHQRRVATQSAGSVGQGKETMAYRRSPHSPEFIRRNAESANSPRS